jgi:hypothetical protein
MGALKLLVGLKNRSDGLVKADEGRGKLADLSAAFSYFFT